MQHTPSYETAFVDIRFLTAEQSGMNHMRFVFARRLAAKRVVPSHPLAQPAGSANRGHNKRILPEAANTRSISRSPRIFQSRKREGDDCSFPRLRII